MATLLELAQLPGSTGFDELRAKITAAVAIKANSIVEEASPSANRLVWAFEAIASPNAKSQELVWGVLAANAGATVSNILSASDGAIQTNVDAFVDKLVP